MLLILLAMEIQMESLTEILMVTVNAIVFVTVMKMLTMRQMVTELE